MIFLGFHPQSYLNTNLGGGRSAIVEVLKFFIFGKTSRSRGMPINASCAAHHAPCIFQCQFFLIFFCEELIIQDTKMVRKLKFKVSFLDQILAKDVCMVCKVCMVHGQERKRTRNKRGRITPFSISHLEIIPKMEFIKIVHNLSLSALQK